MALPLLAGLLSDMGPTWLMLQGGRQGAGYPHHPFPQRGSPLRKRVPIPDVAGWCLLLVLAEPGVPRLVALALADEAVAVLVQRQEGCTCPLALLGRQQPQQRVLDEGGEKIEQGTPLTRSGDPLH